MNILRITFNIWCRALSQDSRSRCWKILTLGCEEIVFVYVEVEGVELKTLVFMDFAVSDLKGSQ